MEYQLNCKWCGVDIWPYDRNECGRCFKLFYLISDVPEAAEKILTHIKEKPQSDSIESGLGFWCCSVCHTEHGLQYHADQCCIDKKSKTYEQKST